MPDPNATVDTAPDTAPRTLPEPPLPTKRAPWALFLDVDGTLTGFHDDPQAVVISPSLQHLLHALQDALQGGLALVSGRELDDLDRLFGHPHWAMAGLHGLELRRADGSFRRFTVSDENRQRMHESTAALAARFPGVRCEDKRSAVALHCRRTPTQFEPLHRAAMELIKHLPGYELQPGNQVIEFKPAGMDKGRVVTELLASQPFAARTPVYLGDDLTDEHAFASVRQKHGIGVLVGPPRATLATFSLPGPAAVEAWLARVLDALLREASEHDQSPAKHPARQP